MAIDILSRCIHSNLYEIHINHTSILEAIWTWSGVKKHERKDVAKVSSLKDFYVEFAFHFSLVKNRIELILPLQILSTAGCTPPQSSDRKSKWFYIRQQLVQVEKAPSPTYLQLYFQGLN